MQPGGVLENPRENLDKCMNVCVEFLLALIPMIFAVEAIGRSKSMVFALEIVLIISTLFLIGGLLYLLFDFGKPLYHDVMGWHKPTDQQGWDGCSFTSTCKHCGKKIMQDSQGNWF